MARIKFDNPNEVMKFHAQESWVPVVLGGIPVAAVCAIVCVIIALPMNRMDLLPYAIAASVIITLASRLPHIIANWKTDVVVTNRRLYYRRGIIKVRDHVCDLTSITDIAVDPSVIGRIFNYANVTIQTQAGDDDFVLKEIKNAYKMRQAINTGRDAAGRQGQQRPRTPRQDQAPSPRR